MKNDIYLYRFKLYPTNQIPHIPARILKILAIENVALVALSLYYRFIREIYEKID